MEGVIDMDPNIRESKKGSMRYPGLRARQERNAGAAAGTHGSRSAAVWPTTCRVHTYMSYSGGGLSYTRRTERTPQEPPTITRKSVISNLSSRSISNTPSLYLPIRQCDNPFPLRHGRSRWTPQHRRGRRLEAAELGLRLS